MKLSCGNIAKLACFWERENNNGGYPSLTPEDFHRFRERGQHILREMIESPGGGGRGRGRGEDGETTLTVDWEAVVRAADELHRQEQLLLKRKEEKELFKLRKKALKRRRRYDKVGSFSINLLTYQKTAPSESSSKSISKSISSTTPDGIEVKSSLLRANSSSSKQQRGRSWSHGTSNTYGPVDDCSCESSAYKSAGTDTMEAIAEESVNAL